PMGYRRQRDNAVAGAPAVPARIGQDPEPLVSLPPRFPRAGRRVLVLAAVATMELRRPLQFFLSRQRGPGAVLRPRIRELLLGPEARLPPPHLHPRRNSRLFFRSAASPERYDQRRHCGRQAPGTWYSWLHSRYRISAL